MRRGRQDFCILAWASVQQYRFPAPARFSIRESSANVAFVVATSSINSKLRFLTSPATRNSPATFFFRRAYGSVLCGGAGRLKTVSSGSSGRPYRADNRRASSPHWLKPRSTNLSRLSGTARMPSIPALCSQGGGRAAISSANKRFKAICRRCLNSCNRPLTGGS